MKNNNDGEQPMILSIIRSELTGDKDEKQRLESVARSGRVLNEQNN